MAEFFGRAMINAKVYWRCVELAKRVIPNYWLYTLRPRDRGPLQEIASVKISSHALIVFT